MEKPRVLLLNPPSKDLHIRDLYCSITSKGNYYWPPIDLLALSGILKNDFRLSVLDAMAEGLSEKQTLRRIAASAPSAVISLTGSSSWPGDMPFLKTAKELFGCRLLISGDICVDASAWPLQSHPWLDALITDFTSSSITDYLQDANPPPRARPGLTVRTPQGLPSTEPPPSPAPRTFSYPAPRHDLFPLGRYRLPYVRRYPFSTVLTNYACPFPCSYCIQNRNVLGFKHRPLENTLEELEYLKHLGVRELYFRDPLFESAPRDAKALCRTLKERFSFRWSCNCRVDTLSEELLAPMKEAGCSLIAFGFETANEQVLARHEKPIALEQMRKAIRLCKKYKILVAGYFILGLPGEDESSVRRTIRFSTESDIDYASFSAPSPDYGTRLRQEAVREGRIGEDYRHFNRSRAEKSLSPELNPVQLKRLLRKAVLAFYWRPTLLFRTLIQVRSARQIREMIRAFLSIFRNYFLNGRASSSRNTS